MKYSEMHKIIRDNGWVELTGRGKGGHRVYAKDGVNYTVPYHGAKEVWDPFRKKVFKEMGIL